MSFKAVCDECERLISADGHIVCHKCHTVVTTELATLKIETARTIEDLTEHNEDLENIVDENKEERKNLTNQNEKLEERCDRLTKENDWFKRTRQLIATTL